MKIEKRDSSVERRILTAMIVDDTVLGRVSAKWRGNMFRSKWANTIARWCVDYYGKYEKAPAGQIEGLYDTWSGKAGDKDTIKIVGRFLDGLSSDYESLSTETNSDYVLDVAGKYFNRVELQRLVDGVQDKIDGDDPDDAYNQVTAFTKVEMGVGEGIDVFQDEEAIREAFRGRGESLVVYPGALGELFGDAMEREGFISFMGPEKRGKTFLLLDVAYRAMLQRRRVAYFDAGDMGQARIMRRFMVRVSHRPFYPGELHYPVGIEKRNGDGMAVVRTRVKRFSKPLSWRKANKACKILMGKIRSKKSYLRLSCHPNSTLSVKMMRGILEGWERDEWVPDVVVIDYADILDMSYRGFEGREKINETWKQMRALSQVFHALVVTATQSDAASYEAKTISKRHFADDKRKFAHVTGMIGINATSEEKDIGVMRLNWVVLRERAFSEKKCVYVAGVLDLANPVIKSCFEGE